MNDEPDGFLGTATTPGAQLVAGALGTAVDLDELAASGGTSLQLAIDAAVAEDYLRRDEAEASRFEEAIKQATATAEQDPLAYAEAIRELRAELIALATIDGTARLEPSAVERLRSDLAEYLATVEGFTGAPAWP